MAIYYVSTTGSDSANGSVNTPFLTWQHAGEVAVPGDTINILPGTYSTPLYPNQNTMMSFDTDGTSGSPITLQGYQGIPIITGASDTPTNDYHTLKVNADWWIVRNLDVTGSKMLNAGTVGNGILVVNCAHCVFDNVRSYGNAGSGFLLGAGTPVTNHALINCDAFDNYDPLTLGENGDGFELGVGVGVTLVGCRSWHNSDDGFDAFGAESPVTFDNCWSWANGYDSAGDGNGFKLGSNVTGPQHILRNNVAFDNLRAGFATNSAAGPILFYQNTAYNNGTDWNIDSSIAHVMKNNIGADATNPPVATLDTFNSWNLSKILTAADFLSVSATRAALARNTDGTLPDLLLNTLFYLVRGSDMRISGTPIVGLPYVRSAPDLGGRQSNPRLIVAP